MEFNNNAGCGAAAPLNPKYFWYVNFEELAKWYINEKISGPVDIDTGWIWMGLTVLWERWFPDIPNFEMIDDKMQAGYKKMDADDLTAASIIWLDLWNDIKKIYERGTFKSIEEFDAKYRGTEFVFNWCYDFEMTLHNAGVKNKNFYKNLINYAEEFTTYFPNSNKSIIQHMKRSIADSYFFLNEKEKSLSLYNSYLQQDPRWGGAGSAWRIYIGFTVINRKAQILNRQRKF